MSVSNTGASLMLLTLCGMSSANTAAYVGLSTTTPASDGSNFTEPSGNGYARVQIGDYATSTSSMGSVTNKTITNTSVIQFPMATASWGTVTYFGIFTASSGGTPILWGVLTDAITVLTNYIPAFNTSKLTLVAS